ncbi:MAG: DUF5685 family protein [Lachnospiraceae bacterium]|nr:DUF5685 family protein [Lachnospiraceae bacterium]
MFGYICINQPELKIKDYETYRGYYCGLCHNLHKRYGRIGQMLLNYDMTFLIILLSGLYEPEEAECRRRCIQHPVKEHVQIRNEITDYAADMNILLSYQKALDDWKDEHSQPKRVLAASLRKDYGRLRKQYSRQAKTLEQCIRKLSEAEENKSEDIDYVAGLTGRFLGEMMVWKEDIWQEELRMLGFYLGKFVYLMDAFEDMEKDEKQGNYNIFLILKEKHPENYQKAAEAILTDMMAECSKVFERLPIIKRAEILRNIIYSGVWCKYAVILEKRSSKVKKEIEEKE